MVETRQQRRLDARRRPDLRRQQARSGVRGIDWRFNAWGGLAGRTLFPMGPGTIWLAPQGARKWSAASAIARRSCNEAAPIHEWTAQGTLLVHRTVHPQRAAIRSSTARRSSKRCFKSWLGVEPSSGSVMACSTMKRTVTSTTCARSSGPAKWRWPGPTIGAIRSTTSRATRTSDSLDARDARGRRFKIHKLPPTRARCTSRRPKPPARPAPAPSRARPARAGRHYVNFYLGTAASWRRCSSRTRRLALRKLQALFPRARGRRRAGARDPARRRQHPLHHAAGAGERGGHSGRGARGDVARSTERAKAHQARVRARAAGTAGPAARRAVRAA